MSNRLSALLIFLYLYLRGAVMSATGRISANQDEEKNGGNFMGAFRLALISESFFLSNYHEDDRKVKICK